MGSSDNMKRVSDLPCSPEGVGGHVFRAAPDGDGQPICSQGVCVRDGVTRTITPRHAARRQVRMVHDD